MAPVQTMSPAKNAAARWQNICHGYNRIWYMRAILRWLLIVVDMVALIDFGVAWSGEEDEYPTTRLELTGLMIATPLLSFLVNVFAIIILFLVRRNKYLNPGWLLACDILSAVFLAFVVGLFAQWYAVRSSTLDPYNWAWARMQVAWALQVVVLILTAPTIAADCWEVNAYRRLSRKRLTDAPKSETMDDDEEDDVELAVLPPSQQSSPPPETTPAPVHVAPQTIRIELPDGRIFELPEGCRVELPAGYQNQAGPSELPTRHPSLPAYNGPNTTTALRTDNLKLSVSELESPSSSHLGLGRSPVSAVSDF